VQQIFKIAFLHAGIMKGSICTENKSSGGSYSAYMQTEELYKT